MPGASAAAVATALLLLGAFALLFYRPGQGPGTQLHSREHSVKATFKSSAAVALLALGASAQAVKVDPKLPKYTPVEGVSGSLKSIGSDTMNNLMTLWQEGFKTMYPNVQIEVEGKGYYNTGDLGFFRDGNLVISGRLKRFLKFAGEMISLPAIEDALIAQWPAGDNGPVVTVDGEEREGQPPIVCLYTTNRAITTEEANRVLKSAGLPSLAYVRHVHVMPEIPLLGSGKTNYRALPRPAELVAQAA